MFKIPVQSPDCLVAAVLLTLLMTKQFVIRLLKSITISDGIYNFTYPLTGS